MAHTISELVQLKTNLQKYADLSKLKQEIKQTQQNIRSLTMDSDLESEVGVLVSNVDKSLGYLEKTDKKLISVMEKINKRIDGLCKHQFAADYGHKMVCTIEQIRDGSRTQLQMDDLIYNTLFGRMQMYADWHYPGLQIGPQDGMLTEQLVACDPLYIADVYPEFLQSTLSQFNEVYQARVRPYSIGQDGFKTKDFSELPQGQFGFVFCWEMFNFVALETLKEYLTEVFGLLRPGGVFLFSFNDGDTINGSKNAEWGGCTFIPKRLLVPLCEQLGYEVIDSFNFQPGISDVSWIEIKKPGQKHTVKAHQVLGMVREVGK